MFFFLATFPLLSFPSYNHCFDLKHSPPGSSCFFYPQPFLSLLLVVPLFHGRFRLGPPHYSDIPRVSLFHPSPFPFAFCDDASEAWPASFPFLHFPPPLRTRHDSDVCLGVTAATNVRWAFLPWIRFPLSAVSPRPSCFFSLPLFAVPAPLLLPKLIFLQNKTQPLHACR